MKRTIALLTVLVVTFAPSLARAGSLAHRHRLQFSLGYWESGLRVDESLTELGLERTSVEDVMGAFSYAHWMEESIAGYLTLKGLLIEANSVSGPWRDTDTAVVISSAILGVRYYPISGPEAPLHPFLSAGVGPYLGVDSRTYIDGVGTKRTRTQTYGSLGGYLGGGLDLQMGRYFMVGVEAGYNLMTDFSEPLAGDRNYSGGEFSIGISALIG